MFIFDLSYLQCTGATVIKKAVLPGRGSQCTKRELNLACFPREWVRGVQFLLDGLTCVRACGPWKMRKKQINSAKKKCKQIKTTNECKFSMQETVELPWLMCSACKFWLKLWNRTESDEKLPVFQGIWIVKMGQNKLEDLILTSFARKRIGCSDFPTYTVLPCNVSL